MSPNTPACAASVAPFRSCGARDAHLAAMMQPSSTRTDPRSHLRHDQAQRPIAHVVRDVHEVVDLRPTRQSRYHRCCPRSIVEFAANLDVILDEAPAPRAGSSRACPSRNTYPKPSEPRRAPGVRDHATAERVPL
jgi:hypothetical protein